MSLINTDETLDELGEFRIIQKKNGYRFSDDSVQLANFVLPLKPDNSVIDLGAGSGVISLILAQKSQIKNIVGMEIQEGLADIAKRNVVFNNLSSRIKIVKGD
ncbi:MAG: methyltransferase, partial [Deltaproteobacteria bacterium]